MVPYKETDS